LDTSNGSKYDCLRLQSSWSARPVVEHAERLLSFVLIAQAVFLLERGQTNRQTQLYALPTPSAVGVGNNSIIIRAWVGRSVASVNETDWAYHWRRVDKLLFLLYSKGVGCHA